MKKPTCSKRTQRKISCLGKMTDENVLVVTFAVVSVVMLSIQGIITRRVRGML